MCEVRIAVDADASPETDSAWHALAAADRAAPPFAHPPWVCGWRAGAADPSFRLVTGWRGSRLVCAIGVFAWEGALRFAGEGMFDLGDALIDPRTETAAGDAVLALETAARVLDVERVSLAQIPANRQLAQRLAHRADVTIDAGVVCPAMAVAGEGGLAAVPARQRRRVRQSQKATAAAGVVIGEIDRAARDDALAHMSQMLATRWGAGAVVGDAMGRRRLAAISARLAEADVLVFLGAHTPDGAACGYLLAQAAGDGLWLLLQAIDAQARALGVGTALIAAAFARAAARGLTRAEFLRGAEPYKAAWGAGGGATVNATWRVR